MGIIVGSDHIVKFDWEPVTVHDISLRIEGGDLQPGPAIIASIITVRFFRWE